MSKRRHQSYVRALPVEVMTHVDASETFTTVTLVGQRYTGLGTAKLHPDDRYDAQVGQDIALARALRELADSLEDGVHQGREEVADEEEPDKFTYWPGGVTITPWR